MNLIMSLTQSNSARCPLLAGIVAVIVTGVGLGIFAFGPNKVLALIHWAESAWRTIRPPRNPPNRPTKAMRL